MNFVILDLEWNGTYSRRLKGFMNEIIEFGAVKVDECLHVLDTFDALVRPQVGKKNQRENQNADKYYKRRTGQRFAVYAGYEPFS